MDPVQVLRRLFMGNERALSRSAQARRVTPEHALLRRFRREFRVRARRESPFIVFGHVPGPDGRPLAIGLPLDRLVGERGTHVLDQGPSRSGKTRLALSVVRQAIRIPKLRVFSIDPKGDLTEGRERILAAEIEKPGGERLLERLRVVRLFDRSTPPPLRLTAREEGVSISVQAASIGTALGEASGAELGSRMGHILHYPSELAIELNQPLTRVLDWLTKPATFAAAAAGSPNERLRHFASHELPRENKESLRALVARLERVLLLPSVRRALEAPTCFNFREGLERYDLILDASNPPAGEEAAVRMLCGPLFGRVTRSILNRHVTAETTPVLCFIDELPEILGRFEAGAEGGVGRLTSLAGSRLVSFFLIAQDRIQLGPELFHLLRTNCLVETVFRPSHRDAELVAHALPVPDGVDRPAQVREALVRTLTRLPRRQFLFWCKDGEVPAHFVTAPFVDLDALPAPEVLRERTRARALTETSPAVDERVFRPADPAAGSESEVIPRPPVPIAPTATDDAGFPSLG
jgi:hypothetical protein